MEYFEKKNMFDEHFEIELIECLSLKEIVIIVDMKLI